MLLFKALTYDRHLTQGRDALRIGVVGKQGDTQSEKMAQATAQQMHGVENMRIRGLKISEELILASSGADVQREVNAKRLNILYLGAGTESMIDQICALAESNKIIVLSGEADHARRCAAVTVVDRDNKPKVLLNLRAAAAQGASFDPALVRVSDLVQ